MRHIIAVHQHFDPTAGDQFERERAIVGSEPDMTNQSIVLLALQFVKRAIGGEHGIEIVVRRNIFEIKNIEHINAQFAQSCVAIGA